MAVMFIYHMKFNSFIFKKVFESLKFLFISYLDQHRTIQGAIQELT